MLTSRWPQDSNRANPSRIGRPRRSRAVRHLRRHLGTVEGKAPPQRVGLALMVEGSADPSRRQLVCTPLAYIGQVLADQTLLAGGTLVLRPKFDPASVLQTIETKRITHLCLVEPLLVELVDHPDFIRRDGRRWWRSATSEHRRPRACGGGCCVVPARCWSIPTGPAKQALSASSKRRGMTSIVQTCSPARVVCCPDASASATRGRIARHPGRARRACARLAPGR